MKVITKKELNEAEQKLMRFCIMFEALCGKKKCTSNMYLGGYLQIFFGLCSSFLSLLLFICELELNEIVNLCSNSSISTVIEVLYVCLQIHG